MSATFDGINTPAPVIKPPVPVPPRTVNYQFKGPITLLLLAKALNTTVDKVTITGVSTVTTHTAGHTVIQTFLKCSVVV